MCASFSCFSFSFFLRKILAQYAILDQANTRCTIWIRVQAHYLPSCDPDLTLHYKRLGLLELENVFRDNIDRLRKMEFQQESFSKEPPLFIMEHEILRFATDHYNKHPKGKGAWNGRQVRNAFAVATSLARYEAENPNLIGKGFQPQLRYSHFQAVERLTTEHDRFRAHILGGDDSRKARLNEERDDDYDDNETNEQATDFASQLRRARLLYNDQPIRTNGQDVSLGVSLSNHHQTPLSKQNGAGPIYTESSFNQSQHQLSMSENKTVSDSTPSRATQAQHNAVEVLQENSPPLPFGRG